MSPPLAIPFPTCWHDVGCTWVEETPVMRLFHECAALGEVVHLDTLGDA